MIILSIGDVIFRELIFRKVKDILGVAQVTPTAMAVSMVMVASRIPPRVTAISGVKDIYKVMGIFKFISLKSDGHSWGDC